MDAFFQTAYCQPPKVLGRQLLPFSLSHVLLLKGLQNGFILHGSGTRQELFTAVLVCSRTHRENGKRLFGGLLPILRLALWSALWTDKQIEIETLRFKTYLSDYCTTPEHWESSEGTGGFRAPWQNHFVLCLCDHYNCTRESAWNTSVSEARCLYDTWAETQGDKTLISEQEQEAAKLAQTIPT